MVLVVHFFDFAQLNSVRALPYAIEWDRRYRGAGLTTLGIHSPRFSFTARHEGLAPALERLGIRHPVADDSGYGAWHDYGCRGCPTLFLWGREDQFSPATDAMKMNAIVLGSRCAIIPNCGHFPSLEYPDRTSMIIIDWLKHSKLV